VIHERDLNTHAFALVRMADNAWPPHVAIYTEGLLPLSAIQATHVWKSPAAVPYNGFTRIATFTD
jgi:hypothetical protein